ncbi:MAG TPA: DNA polymerase III subunit beta [Halanaerobiales bacterium]|nr:DNA polymerase III subunit beta [Halanaerobiales bacterium]
MFFNILQSKFNKGIQIVQKAVSSKSTLPILTGIYLQAVKNKGVRLVSNNLEIGIEYWVKAEVKEEGSIVLPANQLSNIVRELPSAEIILKVELEKQQANLKCLNSEFVLKGFQADEFPKLPEVKVEKNFKVKVSAFKKMLEEVKFSVSSDQTQPSLTGGLMLLEDNKTSMVTTNTYRLAYSWFKNDNTQDEEISFILPGVTLNELSNLLDGEEELELLIGDSYVCFNFNEIIFISRLIEGDFPNFREVLPGQYKSRVKVDRKELLKAARRVSLIARLNSNVISLKTTEEQLHIKPVDSEFGDAHEILEIEIEGNKEGQNIDIDAGYLIDVLNVLNDDVVLLEFISSINPLTVSKSTEDDYIYLIMPIRPGA